MRTTTQCPGCHFGCALSAYQCGRGKEFYELAAAGEPVPERQWPMLTPGEKAAGIAGKPPVNERLMRGLNIAAQSLQRRHEENAEKKVVAALARGGGFMARPILSKRTQIDSAELPGILEGTCAAEWTALRAESIPPLPADGDASARDVEVISITEAGKAQAALWAEERDVATEEFLQPLSNDEREQLDALLEKLMRFHAPKGPRGNREHRGERRGER